MRKMLRLCLCVLAGAYALSIFRDLPGDAALVGTALSTGLCLWLKKLRAAGFLLLGLVVMWIASRATLVDRLQPELQGEPLAVTVQVATFPEVLPGSVRFVAHPVDDPVEEGLSAPALPAKIRLSWYEPP